MYEQNTDPYITDRNILKKSNKKRVKISVRVANSLELISSKTGFNLPTQPTQDYR